MILSKSFTLHGSKLFLGDIDRIPKLTNVVHVLRGARPKFLVVDNSKKPALSGVTRLWEAGGEGSL